MMRWAYIALGILVSTFPGVANALKGTVIDGSTGKPLAGVYVIGAWHVGGGLVIASTSCAKLDVVQTDPAGRFSLPRSTGRPLVRLLGSESLDVTFYKRGYRVDQTAQEPNAPQLAKMSPEVGVAADRIGTLREIMATLDCGDDRASRRNRLTVSRMIAAEASSLATTDADIAQLNQLLFWLDVLEVGEKEADTRFERRESDRLGRRQ